MSVNGKNSTSIAAFKKGIFRGTLKFNVIKISSFLAILISQDSFYNSTGKRKSSLGLVSLIRLITEQAIYEQIVFSGEHVIKNP